MPTDRRTKSSVTPVVTCSSGVSCECVVEAGWIASDFASPMFARCENSCSELMNVVPPRGRP